MPAHQCFIEFTPHQREVFCVFSGPGVVGLRRYLNTQTRNGGPPGFEDDDVTLTGDNDDATMTGMMEATALNGGEEDGEVDEELDDADETQNAIQPT